VKEELRIAIFYVGTSLLAPLRRAEREINKQYSLGLNLSAHNCGAPLSEEEWASADRDITAADIIFIIHVTEQENAQRILTSLDRQGARACPVIAFNCMPDLMRRTRLGRLDFGKLMKSRAGREGERGGAARARNLARKLSSWIADTFKSGRSNDNGKGSRKPGDYLKLIARLPAILRLVPTAGKLGDIKNYLYLFCYFLQPSPANIRSMLLYAIKYYGSEQARRIKVPLPEAMPTVAIYHPESSRLFDTFDEYQRWYERTYGKSLEPESTVGLLLFRTHIVSDSRRHYDALIKSIEQEGLGVIPAISTFMDNREACRQFFIAGAGDQPRRPRVSQIVSLTGFSFVGGPAMNDSQAAVDFLNSIKVPYRSMVSLDVQTIEDWQQSRSGLNPIQSAMQVAIPEIDGATEPFVFGGLTRSGSEPEPLEDRCRRVARRLARWNHLRAASRSDLRLAFLIFCFPPNKGNIGTAADLDVFPSLCEILRRLKQDGYTVDVPERPEELRERLLGGNSSEFGTVGNVAYRMGVDEYRKVFAHVREIEREWGRAPGTTGSNGRELLISGLELGNIFIGVQPTFGYEGDPMRLLMAESGAPHHGFAAVYAYIEKVFRADAVIHVGTHGAMEFMPGKQVGLSGACWPDRLVGELPNIYLYSVNNPSEGTIAKRRSYAELVSYLTPPIENAGLYRELSSMKDLLAAYRKSTSEAEREQLFEAIEEKARELNLC
jgi:magnesium chelatase subunit H